MRKINFILIAMLMLFLFLSSGCTKPSDKTATISANSDSAYVNTFKELSLGILYDFDFRLPDADKRMVTIWVEGYQDGEKEPDPLTQLIYGSSPNQFSEGHVGFGIINPSTDEPLLFLYAPGVSALPHKVEELNLSGGVSTWDYAIGDETIELIVGETHLLGVYRQPSDNVIRTYDLQDKDAVEQMIQEDHRVLLLKMKIEESHE